MSNLLARIRWPEIISAAQLEPLSVPTEPPMGVLLIAVKRLAARFRLLPVFSLHGSVVARLYVPRADNSCVHVASIDVVRSELDTTVPATMESLRAMDARVRLGPMLPLDGASRSLAAWRRRLQSMLTRMLRAELKIACEYRLASTVMRYFASSDGVVFLDFNTLLVSKTPEHMAMLDALRRAGIEVWTHDIEPPQPDRVTTLVEGLEEALRELEQIPTPGTLSVHMVQQIARAKALIQALEALCES